VDEEGGGTSIGPLCLAPCMPAGIGGPNSIAIALLSGPIISGAAKEEPSPAHKGGIVSEIFSLLRRGGNETNWTCQVFTYLFLVFEKGEESSQSICRCVE